MMRVFLVSLFLLWALATTVTAHEVRPAYLELRETAPDTYNVLWKVPANGEMRLALSLRFPGDTRQLSEPRGIFSGGAHLERWRIVRPGGLAGQNITIVGLSSTKIDALVRITSVSGVTQTLRATPDSPFVTIAKVASGWQVARTYTALGIEHILLGVDHLLFVFGLLLIVGNGWMLFKTITAFTVAHSITLAVATLGYASAPLPPLNAAIALSILFLGPEIVRVWRGESSLTIRYPWLVAFVFGLLHGFGFASGLKATGLPQTDIAWSLLLFNVGVEIGQVLFVLLILTLARSFRQLEIRWPRWALALPGYTVGSLGAFWTIQRTAILLGFIE